MKHHEVSQIYDICYQRRGLILSDCLRIELRVDSRLELRSRGPVAALIACLFVCGNLFAETADEGNHFFESKIRPILFEHCYSCHSAEADEANGDLRLDTAQAIVNGGTRGSAITKGSPDQSILFRAVKYDEPGMQMPPDGKIADEKIADLRRWIELGAPDPRGAIETLTPEQKKEALLATKFEKSRLHWAYQQLPEQIAAPEKEFNSDPWVREALDARVLAKMKIAGLVPSAEADRRTLVRRLYYDLLGLPPTVEQIEAVINDTSDNWYQSLVESLLGSPHFGERMARRWMDVVRYADNKGYVFVEDREYANAYRYRDWLIKSFNHDLPYSDFIRFQLVADRLDPQNAQGQLDAMGMLTLGRRFLQNADDIADDRIDVVTRGLMGVTAACARCHDHKFDAVTQADYYSLHGAFMGSHEPGDEPSPLRMVDRDQQGETFVYLRGKPGSHGAKIERKFFTFLDQSSPRPLSTGSGRLELAEAIASRTNPLTSRVYVNRIWGWIMGSLIVDTPSDFGLRCEAPLHQDVLDDLAIKFVENGWSTKELVKRIAMSATYRQASLANDKSTQIDPENRYLWRANRKRADFESYRDALLKVAGTLDPTISGKSEVIHAEPFSKRRTVYAYIDRQNLPQLFRTFDFASPDAHVPQRSQTTVPQQGLVLLNSDMMRTFVQPLAQEAFRIGKEQASDGDTSKGILASTRWLYQQILAREPSAKELELMALYIQNADTSLPATSQNVWSYGHGSVNVKLGRLAKFELFPEVHDHAWRTSSVFPDPNTGWVTLNAGGGHAGASTALSAIRRWTAPTSGVVDIHGMLTRPSNEGDGIRGHIVIGQKKRVGGWTLATGEQETHVDKVSVEAGQTIDFVVDCNETDNSDSFSWPVTIRYQGAAISYDSKRDFSESTLKRDTIWHQVAQALLLTNEFCFID